MPQSNFEKDELTVPSTIAVSVFDARCTCGSVSPVENGSWVLMRNYVIFMLSVFMVPFLRDNTRSHVIPANTVVTKRDRS